ncbi:porin family protein [Marinilabiliaceae bacterium ANBcel2]|nr:porin family protein [Marinilabiliaceae bacterium ANBcel2]
MKKAAVVLILIITTGYINAQNKGDYRFSLLLTPQISWMSSDNADVSGNGSKLGYNFGVLIDRFFGTNYAIATGLTINTTGGKLKYSLEDEISRDFSLKYIEVPLGLRLRSEDLWRSNIYGRFGLSPQINIQAQDSDGNSMSSNVKNFDIGYHLGGGIEYSIGSRNAIMIGLLYNSGFSDTTKRLEVSDKSVLNRLVFELGFIF